MVRIVWTKQPQLKEVLATLPNRIHAKNDFPFFGMQWKDSYKWNWKKTYGDFHFIDSDFYGTKIYFSITKIILRVQAW